MNDSERWLAFDIETAKEVPGDDFDWRRYRPLGITCAATLSSDEDQPRVWMSRRADGTPAGQMGVGDLEQLVRYLAEQSRRRYRLVTWNGLAFDFDVLAEESRMIDACRQLARSHVDMMFHVVCAKGFPVALKNAAAGMGLQGKLQGVAGIDAPRLWRQGEFQTVIEYVEQDVRTTLAVAQEGHRSRQFAWRNQRGGLSTMPLPDGWLNVTAAEQLPLPDTSWMDRPLPRDQFTGWLNPPSPRGILRRKTAQRARPSKRGPSSGRK